MSGRNTGANFWQEIPKPVIGLSPMDGVTDASFRWITAKYGAPDVSFTEFVNVETAFFAPQVLLKDLSYSEMERPVVAQIYGRIPEFFYKVALVVCELGFDGLDINMGCPARKVAARGCGAALILNPSLAQSIIRAARQGISDWFQGQTLGDLKMNPELIRGIRTANRRRTGREIPARRCRIPVSVKTRLGYDGIVVEEWIRALLDERPAVISLHGRTLKQMYKGSADWEAIARAVNLAMGSQTLILGNGDLRDMRNVCRRVRETQVDGVLLGRAVQGNPWVFKSKDQVKQFLRGNGASCPADSPVGLEQRVRVMLEHCLHFEGHWGVSRFVGMRKHLAWYCKALHRASELRSQLVRVNNVTEVMECLRSYVTSVANGPRPVAEFDEAALHATAPTPGFH